MTTTIKEPTREELIAEFFAGHKGEELMEVAEAASEMEIALDRHAHTIRTETAKAYGGCEKCYGKGYSTVLVHHTAHADFIGDKTYTTQADPIVPCSCDRGKQIAEMKASIRTETLKEVRGWIEMMKIPPIAVSVGGAKPGDITDITYRGISEKDWDTHNHALTELQTTLEQKSLPTSK